MSELEMEIGRNLGASAFFIYQTLKSYPNMTVFEIMAETGMSENAIRTAVSKLESCGHLNKICRVRGQFHTYTVNVSEECYV